MKQQPKSIAYALTWKCYCNCPICLSGSEEEEYLITDINRWKEIVAPVLRYNGSVRLTLTGGEPMLFWDTTDELPEFIKYLHENEIHVCLNTTGANMTAEKLKILGKYLDTILLSVRGLTVKEVSREFGVEEKYAKKLLDTQLMILHEIHKTNIRLEISTVVTKENYSRIDNLGSELCKINKNIIWRVEEYYWNGRQLNQPKGRFDLEADQYAVLLENLNKKYSKYIFIRSSSKEGRINAPDPIIFPDGMLHSTSDHSYKAICPLEQFDFANMKTRRDWSSYKNSLRDWGWERDE
jgi:MoaA/NifB/PqqE/SkfB family radical SAM enzyme